MREFSNLCREAEMLGASALWACDHLFWHGPVLECMTALTIAATATERALLGSCVIQLPLRQPATVAKQAASNQQLSGGRFVLGVGVGSHVGEYEQAGIDYHTRGRRLDDGIADGKAEYAAFKKDKIDTHQVSSADLFGNRDHLQNNYLSRYAGANLHLFGNSGDERAYLRYSVDSEGKPANGARHSYTLHFAKDQ
jgi:hypothetical protein